MEQILVKFYEEFKKKTLKERKRFQLADLEGFLIKKTGGASEYQSVGGYQALYQVITEKEKKGELIAIKSSPYNGRQPALKSRWQFLTLAPEGWDDHLIFRLSRQLDLSYYLKRPELQTEKLASELINVAEFMTNKGNREWASREERSLELFADEKFLSSTAGRKLLSRLKLSLADLKAEKYSQMFVYWNKGTKISKVLILENHSAFIACKRALEAGYDILGYPADTLIYGQGKHIIDSLKFIDELLISQGETRKKNGEILEHQDSERTENQTTAQILKSDTLNENGVNLVLKPEIRYAGDIDPEGWLIYHSLKEKYPAYSLELFMNYYQEIFNKNDREAYPIRTRQQKNETILTKIREEFMEKGQTNLLDMVEELWKNDLRLPQEIITYEVLLEF
ncbi:hypothetical protein [Natronospora cellulosivora (SeqCode)]